MSFIASGKLPDPKESADALADQLIQPDPFWPELGLSEFRRVMRTDDTVSTERVLFELESALHDVSAQLDSVRAAVLSSGVDTFAESFLEPHLQARQLNAWQTAVFNEAKARILENYTDVGTTQSGASRAEAMRERIEMCRVRVAESIRFLRGKPKVTVELI